MLAEAYLGLDEPGQAWSMTCAARDTSEKAANDFAAMEKPFGSDLTYNHSSAAVDSKASYIDSMRSGRVQSRKMTPNNDLKTRTYGCLALITGTAVYEVTVGGGERVEGRPPRKLATTGSGRPSRAAGGTWTMQERWRPPCWSANIAIASAAALRARAPSRCPRGGCRCSAGSR